MRLEVKSVLCCSMWKIISLKRAVRLEEVLKFVCLREIKLKGEGVFKAPLALLYYFLL